MSYEQVLPSFLCREFVAAQFALRSSPLRNVVMAMRHRQLSDRDVFFASYSNSGNTCLRHLLTHIATGQTTPWRGGLDKICSLVGHGVISE